MGEKTPLIIINDVEYSYPNGSKALDGVNLNIYKGELVGIMGQNGAGKTTLIRTLNGLIRPSKGKIFIGEDDLSSKTIANLSQRVGIIFQNPSHQLFSNTVEDEIKFSLKSLNLEQEVRESRINEYIDLFDFEDYRERSPLNLSGGESKKLAVASMVCRDPDIIVFDEPTLGQDAKEIEFFINLLDEEVKRGKTIIIVTHNVEFAVENIPRIILMAKGKIIADGPTKEILTKDPLIKESSLVLPQITEFGGKLKDLGLAVPNNIYTKQEMIDYLKKEFFKFSYHE